MGSSGGFSHQSLPRADGPPPDPAHGVFETLLVVRGEPLELGPHLTRLDASLRELFGRPAPDGARALLAEHARGLALGRVRIAVAPRDAALATEVTAAPVDRAFVLPPWAAAARLEAVVVAGWRGGHKWADRRLLELEEGRLAPAVPLLVDPDGLVLEGSRANVFAVRDGAVATPPLDGRVLPGVTRALVCELAREAGLDVRERPLTYEELLEADEVFVTSAVRGLGPVAACEPGGRWAAGAVGARLAEALRRRWRIFPSAA